MKNNRYIWLMIAMLLMLPLSRSVAQISITGNVYGGGDHGEVKENTTVTLRGCNIDGSVFGGARIADVGGRTFVNVDGEHASSYIIANYVYGGNDIAGTIGTNEELTKTVPTELKNKLDAEGEETLVDDSWDAYVHITSMKEEDDNTTDNQKVYIGQLFGGGNGDYTYAETTNDDGEYEVKDVNGDVVATSEEQFTVPELKKTYLEVLGGSIVYAYGGGNNVTVSESTVIHVNNPSTVVNEIKEKEDGPNLLDNDRFERMGINTGFSYPSSGEFQIGRFFGGNNKATMGIRPTWHLLDGKIREVFSGGNHGDMICQDGLLLEIEENSEIVIDNLYGGCRMANVTPKKDGKPDGAPVEVSALKDYDFPAGMSARVLIKGGDINNVYGGNDITGSVQGGSAIGLHASIRGNVYGGGNGAYPYTDNANLKDDPIYGDLYYDPGENSVEALNNFRPNAEQVAIRVAGASEKKPTVIGGAIYLGGNCATLKTTKSNPILELQIGSYVYADKVFLGNNGEGMIGTDHAEEGEADLQAAYEGVLYTYQRKLNTLGYTGDTTPYNTMELTKPETFAQYMRGAAMTLKPAVKFVDDYVDFSSYFGSYFCGGNVGSIITDGKISLNFNKPVVIYDKLVGGCNDAYVAATDYNAEYHGGVLNDLIASTEDGDIADKLELNLEGLTIQPKRWMVERDADTYKIVKNAEGNVTYVTDANGNRQLEWNTISKETGEEVEPVTTSATYPVKSSDDDLDRRLKGGNIYGGCYNSGIIDGNVVINLNGTILDRWHIFDTVKEDEGEAKLYDNSTYHITERHSGVILDEQGMDVLGSALNVFGGGYGVNSEIWGSTTINLKKGYTFQIFGGSERGAIGKKNSSGEYTHDERYSTYINLCGDIPGVARNAAGDSEDMAAAEFIYGGGFEGIIAGSTHINLGNGRIFNSFAGSCNADILGHTETYVGRGTNSDAEEDRGFPWIRDHIYGGNDLGGKILNSDNYDFKSRVREEAFAKVYNPENSATGTVPATPEVLKAGAYIEYLQGRVENIFAGCYGDYNYTHDEFPDYINEDESLKAGFTKPRLGNAFVYFHPVVESNKNKVEKIYGAGQGHTGEKDMNNMQERSYVLVDVPQSMTQYLGTEVFGAGAYGGLGMGIEADEAKKNTSGVEAAAVIDLVQGQISAAYGANHKEGVTRRTIVNVPEGSTIAITNIFGGAYGENNNLKPCDAYETHVNYNSGDAFCKGGVFGGNNAYRRTLYSQVNINAPILQASGRQGYAYGGGLGPDTWAEYTEVHLNEGGLAYKIYGGGSNGMVLNETSVKEYAKGEDGTANTSDDFDLTIGPGYENEYLEGYLAQEFALAEDIAAGRVKTDAAHSIEEKKYNTNVLIHEGGHLPGYGYGGGYGDKAIVSGDTYIALVGGTVDHDIYAGGESGGVYNLFEDNNDTFTATANAYAKGGTTRNIYGGGWRGDVGYHLAPDPDENKYFNTDNSKDKDGIANVIVGNLNPEATYLDGDPAIQRNAYGAGEGGSIYGTSNLIVYNGHMGYRYINGEYVEELLDGTSSIDLAGNAFGGGYVANSYTDFANVTMYGGILRGSLYGGGEIGPVGRGAKRDDFPGSEIVNHGAKIYKEGKATVTLYGGHVMRDVFGGGRGFDNWNGDGTLWYSDEEVEMMDLTAKGFVYGTTEVNIYGGEVGTDAGIGLGYGNVFGGGNVGFVYSAKGKKSDADGYYYDNDKLTEDTKVVVKPYCLVKTAYDSYKVGDYVDTETLDSYDYATYWSKDGSKYGCLDQTGITIHNAVFAGGNVSAGSDQVYVNASTVFGNSTASVLDLFEIDLISIGDDGIGGLYGDGNLTFVDGYRELNITNYGTDYNHLNKELTYDDYKALNKRQAAYYELKYKAKTTHTYEYYMCLETHSYDGVTYKKGQKITSLPSEWTDEEKKKWSSTTRTTNYAKDEQISATDYDLFSDEEKEKWDLYGFCTLFKGRMINTIQRADFCGVFGSRIVLRGARDRVPSVVDYTDYTINRVDELSLNQISNTTNTDKHGNYFGIYNVVHYLGALTSDVNFQDAIRVTEISDNNNYQKDFELDGKTYSYGDKEATYYNWKRANLTNRTRNNGTSPNEVALASGVWLEILDKATETSSEKVYGPITGVVQLDLINVAQGEGGGYVYAKNEHHVVAKWEEAAGSHTTLVSSNEKAVSYLQFTYEEGEGNKIAMETSGNFVNSVKRIVDDCYPTSGAYMGSEAAPAHYWYIRGEYYVYDEYISAYTGSAQSYAEAVSIPLTITAESQGKLWLQSVQPNLYAYWEGDAPSYASSTDTDAIVVGGITYHKNDPISYWAWSHLSEAEQEMFTKESTYVCTSAATYNGHEYKVGDIFLYKPYDIYVCTQTFTKDSKTYTEGETVITATDYEKLDDNAQSNFTVVFNPSNAISNSEGFVLTFDWDNPDIWNDYYHAPTTTDKIRASLKGSEQENWIASPSFLCNQNGVYGQRKYNEGDIIGKTAFDEQDNLGSNKPKDGQADFNVAYVAKENCKFTLNIDGKEKTFEYVKGACITKEEYDALGSAQSYFALGYLCTETFSVIEDEKEVYYLYGQVIPKEKYEELINAETGTPALVGNFSEAYLCSTAGLWGGEYFEQGTNYEALKYTNLSKSERANFSFNYDALDVLLDENYTDQPKLYDSKNGAAGEILYATKQSIDYTATYKGETNLSVTNSITLTRNNTSVTTNEIQNGDVLDNVAYETGLINEQRHFSPIVIVGTDIRNVYYIVTELFQICDKVYLPGNVITEEVYGTLSDDNKKKVTTKSRQDFDNVEPLPASGSESDTRYYFCTSNVNTYEVGKLIKESDYQALKNEQVGFVIDGTIPTQTSTLYVARETNIDQLSKDKIITVTYWYDYVESDETGSSYENIREKHVVNIHIHFESGVPTIGDLLPPSTILPGDYLSLNQPTVSRGAFEVVGGGWEIYPTEAEAVRHHNGSEYVNYGTPLYWYQNDYWVAYYAKSYLGKTYSNPVQIKVANYHDIDDVMKDREHHMYIDNKTVQRAPKIYIDNRNDNDPEKKSELDLLSDLFQLTLHPMEYNSDGSSKEITISEATDPLYGEGHHGVDTEQIGAAKNLELFLRSNVKPNQYTSWTPIGTDGHCFEGTLHGDGYTISDLSASLFKNLCGEVYNLGVTGSFTSAGIVDTGTGYVENCWVMSSANSGFPADINAVFGNPSDTKGTQVVNCYYPETNAYAEKDNGRGLPMKKPLKDFYNGEVAYDLNGFYLQKRFSDHKTISNRKEYKFFDSDDLDGEGKMTLKVGAYDTNDNYAIYPLAEGAQKLYGYVENRYADGDFIYAGGNIPENDNERLYNDVLTGNHYYPIWPDDYIFFGQMLTYDYVPGRDHETTPAHINKTNERLRTSGSNRVYRAPAYYQSKEMQIAHFNPDALFAKKSADGTHEAFPGLTAIDFTGHNEITSYEKGRYTGAPYTKIEGGAWYPPLLDDDGLLSFQNIDLTRNLLVYIPQPTADATDAVTKTNTVVTSYLSDPTFTESNSTYRTVNTSTATIHGHRIVKDSDGEGYTAPVDHLLVDKEDFNAPIAYRFATGKRMWYQRRPDRYVDLSKGWEAISIPFSPELVTTQTKGELTHFYQTEGQDKGHEYWLRQLDNLTVDGGSPAVATATFNPMAAGTEEKVYTNTFLWDFYYSHENNLDHNEDNYQKAYYSASHTFDQYPLAQAAAPYLIGFPGSRYYEFDLSGTFLPKNSYNDTYFEENRVPRQTITFASKTATTIAVSDDEVESASATNKIDGDGTYTFKPNYLSREVTAGVYMLNEDGNSFEKTGENVEAVPFRPYFTYQPSSSTPEPRHVQRITFNQTSNSFGIDDRDPSGNGQGDLDIYAKKGKIIVASALSQSVGIRIVTTTGATVSVFTIDPGETVETRVPAAGIYIVGTGNGQAKKISVTSTLR